MKFRYTTLCVFVLSACGSDDPIHFVRFDADSRPTQAALWIETSVESQTGVVEVWAAELGAVFGYNLHLTFDATLAEIDTTALEAAPALLGEHTIALRVVRPGDLSIGATRKNPSLGDATIVEPVRLDSIALRPLAAGKTRLDLSRITVRRSDGSYVSVEPAGGSLVIGGGE